MAIIELHLDRPALKRVEPSPGTERSQETETHTSKTYGETSEDGGGGGSMMRKLLLVALLAGVAFAVVRWQRSGTEEETAIDIGTEETRPTTE